VAGTLFAVEHGALPHPERMKIVFSLQIISLTPRTIKISGSRCQGWDWSRPVKRALRRGKFLGEIHFFFAFCFAKCLYKTTYKIQTERFPQQKGSKSTSFGAESGKKRGKMDQDRVF
jgi:hypothetical protein